MRLSNGAAESGVLADGTESHADPFAVDSASYDAGRSGLDVDPFKLRAENLIALARERLGRAKAEGKSRIGA